MQNLLRRGGTYHARFFIPADRSADMGKAMVRGPLGGRGTAMKLRRNARVDVDSHHRPREPLVSHRIVVVHDEPGFVEEVPTALRRLGYVVTAFSRPRDALDDLTAIRRADLLVTRVHFGEPDMDGVRLALLIRKGRSDLKVLFAARSEYAGYGLDLIGRFLPLPVHVPTLVAAVKSVLPSPTTGHSGPAAV